MINEDRSTPVVKDWDKYNPLYLVKSFQRKNRGYFIKKTQN